VTRTRHPTSGTLLYNYHKQWGGNIERKFEGQEDQGKKEEQDKRTVVIGIMYLSLRDSGAKVPNRRETGRKGGEKQNVNQLL